MPLRVTVLLVGPSGAFKTTSAQQLARAFSNSGMEHRPYDDYTELDHMSMWGSKPEREAFVRHEPSGFDVRESATWVLDEALLRTHQRMQEDALARSLGARGRPVDRSLSTAYLVETMEFARTSYDNLDELLDPAFLRTCFVLYLSAPSHVLKQRLAARSRDEVGDHPSTSPEMFDRWYGPDTQPYMRKHFASRYGLPPERVHVIDTENPEQWRKKLRAFHDAVVTHMTTAMKERWSAIWAGVKTHHRWTALLPAENRPVCIRGIVATALGGNLSDLHAVIRSWRYNPDHYPFRPISQDPFDEFRCSRAWERIVSGTSSTIRAHLELLPPHLQAGHVVELFDASLATARYNDYAPLRAAMDSLTLAAHPFHPASVKARREALSRAREETIERGVGH